MGALVSRAFSNLCNGTKVVGTMGGAYLGEKKNSYNKYIICEKNKCTIRKLYEKKNAH